MKEKMETDESKLIKGAIQGNLNAFNQLVMIYQTAVYNTALRIVYDEDRANDLAQTAFISAWQHMDSFKGDSFKPWILRITINACYDELRRQRRHPSVPLEPVSTEDDEENEDVHWLMDPSPQPSQTTETNEMIQAVENCLNRLPFDYRSVLLLIDVQELDYQEASEVLDKPLGTVKSRLFRARQKMRDCLKEKGELFSSEDRYFDRKDEQDNG
ncbi:MAG TPA: RNA polymerase sigma factor [Flexilinea sp.]|jgi:RNA polymerase sigma-70 factor (ECF subfamily)|nr:MAG: ECF RNA polymerase sigma-E factor [Chloroflexi bacterium ADurb.Bin344]HOG60025.1 RNA polymerase sigma factor [Flexilinea sp.]HPB39467.1 RNA polymerase sigma factor [Flexilinea sp.]HPG18997.1 RNA polymerase sigma factor [Flexilinea sp.]HPL58254.1 RNA polymerase sigma factor [Flexilinea sp.]